MANSFGSYIVSWDFPNEDTGVFIVGYQENSNVTIVNAFEGKEAHDIYKKLSGEAKKTEVAE